MNRSTTYCIRTVCIVSLAVGCRAHTSPLCFEIICACVRARACACACVFVCVHVSAHVSTHVCVYVHGYVRNVSILRCCVVAAAPRRAAAGCAWRRGVCVVVGDSAARATAADIAAIRALGRGPYACVCGVCACTCVRARMCEYACVCVCVCGIHSRACNAMGVYSHAHIMRAILFVLGGPQFLAESSVASPTARLHRGK